ncbi:MAG: LPS export ABC transporter permease LptG [Desulfatirhabdiaceae bacterium]
MMTLLDRYLTREILKYFSLVLALVVGVYLVVDFFERIDNFMEVGVPFSRAVTYFIHKIPFIVSQILPVGVLLAILICFGIMIKHNEIIALKSSGISVYSLLRPVLSIGLIFTILLFFLQEIVVPATLARANAIWIQEVRKEHAVLTREQNIWIREKRAIIHIRHFNPSEAKLFFITLNYFDDQFNLVRRLDAEEGRFENGQLRLFKILEQTLDTDNDVYRINHHDELAVVVELNADDLKTVAKDASEMGFRELLEYIKKIEGEGYSAGTYRVDLQAKIAFPFVCMIMSIVGLGISLRGNLKEGMPVGIAYGIGMAFLYWVFNSFCTSLGYGEMLPSVISVWLANLIFLCVGLIALINAE